MATRATSLRRHLTPCFIVTLYHWWRSRAMVSLSAWVQYGPEISLGPGTVVKAFAVVQSGGGRVVFGRQCAISCFVHISTGSSDFIAGDYVRIAPNCTLVGVTKEIHARDVLIKDQPESEKQGVIIGDDVLIGAGGVVLPGSRIGQGAVVGAGSVVSGVVPEYAIVTGMPAKVIGYRE